MQHVNILETAVDELRRGIRHQLYSKMLLPESRGDMLSLLETIDNVIDTTEEVLVQFDIQRPKIPKELNKDFIELVDASCKAADFTVLAARCYINNSDLINDHINKTFFYEHEADKVENRIKRKLFGSDDFVTDLAGKAHLSKFVELIAKLSDDGQDVCERLSVATIKRSI
jgi:predicted phosphate transport protein (TIGR00153 family)